MRSASTVKTCQNMEGQERRRGHAVNGNVKGLYKFIVNDMEILLFSHTD